MPTNFFSIHDEFDGARLKPQTINVTKAANGLHPVLKHAAKSVPNKWYYWRIPGGCVFTLHNLDWTKLRCFPLRKKTTSRKCDCVTSWASQQANVREG